MTEKEVMEYLISTKGVIYFTPFFLYFHEKFN
jgi:hypothetical protein